MEILEFNWDPLNWRGLILLASVNINYTFVYIDMKLRRGIELKRKYDISLAYGWFLKS